MCSDEHVPQSDEVAVFQVLHCNSKQLRFENKNVVWKLLIIYSANLSAKVISAECGIRQKGSSDQWPRLLER